jgi:hypothetical protein
MGTLGLRQLGVVGGKMRQSKTRRELHAFRVEWLTTFLQVVDCGGFEAKAVEPLGVSASTVNRHVGNLEAWLRKPIFTMDYPKELTAFGKEFEITARNILQKLDEAQYIPPQPKPEKPISGKDIDMSWYNDSKDNISSSITPD